MEVYALVGASGTGKSHRARIVAYGNNINYIIDDGLLIKGNKVIAGKSAKQESSKIKAVKRAIFMEEEHAREVRQEIREQEVDKILILGTSIDMIERIIDALELDDPMEIINIEDITTPEEREKARYHREKQGKHVIPVPTIEVKSRFPDYLMDSLELLFSNQNDDEVKAEKTIVRPRFSYYGNLLIADNVIVELIEHLLDNDYRVVKYKRIKVDQQEDGTEVSIIIDVKYGLKLYEVAKELQLIIKGELEQLTGISILGINIAIDSLAV